MKVIFLDIDGVLNCKQTPNPRKFPYIIDQRLLARFKNLISRTNAQVVLSSTWRLDPAGVFSAEHYGVPFMDLCPDMPDRPRRDEALTWLSAHPDVARFAIIDDEDDELDGLPLFQPSCQTGITDQIAEGVAELEWADRSDDAGKPLRADVPEHPLTVQTRQKLKASKTRLAAG